MRNDMTRDSLTTAPPPDLVDIRGLHVMFGSQPVLRDIHLQKIYVSQFVRTQETAAPIAKLQQ